MSEFCYTGSSTVEQDERLVETVGKLWQEDVNGR